MGYSESTKDLFSVFLRVRNVCRRQRSVDLEAICEGALFGLLFEGTQHEENPEKIRMSDISRELMISKPAATQMVDRLESRGLVERVRDEEDRRVVSIQPTPMGEACFAEGMEMGLEFIDRVVARMGNEKADRLVKLMNQFLDYVIEEMQAMDVI